MDSGRSPKKADFAALRYSAVRRCARRGVEVVGGRDDAGPDGLERRAVVGVVEVQAAR
jgi:hypothetical protein